jgi:hypothetical protein
LPHTAAITGFKSTGAQQPSQNSATIIPFRREAQEATMAGDYFAFFFKLGF